MEDLLGKYDSCEGIAFANVERHPIMAALKQFWSEQGDFLSKQNAGTTSTISKVSKDGKEGFLGQINHRVTNVQRYLVNTLTENYSQNSIDIILGKHAQSTS